MQCSFFFPLILSCYCYQPRAANIIKTLSTRMKLGVKVRQTKLMGGGNGHWIFGHYDRIDLIGKKTAEKPRSEAVGWRGEKNSKGGLLSAFTHTQHQLKTQNWRLHTSRLVTGQAVTSWYIILLNIQKLPLGNFSKNAQFLLPSIFATTVTFCMSRSQCL